MKRIVALALFAILTTPAVALAQQCLHGADETAEQKARKREALQATRQVNSLQAGLAGREKRYLDQGEMATWYADMARTKSIPKPLIFDPVGEVIPGWQLTLDKTPEGYWFMIKDKTDPCGFAYISNQNGVIYTAEPIR